MIGERGAKGAAEMMCRNKQKILVFSIVLCFIVLLTFALSGCTKNAAEYAIYTNTFEEVNQAAFIIAQNALNTEPCLNEIHGRATDEITDLQLVYKDGKKLCPEISVGDYVISINGIDQKYFILDDLQNYDTIEMTLKHKNKTYSANLDRRYFENCLEY